MRELFKFSIEECQLPSMFIDDNLFTTIIMIRRLKANDKLFAQFSNSSSFLALCIALFFFFSHVLFA